MGRCGQALRELVNATSDHLARLFAACEEDARAGFLEGNCILVTVIADDLSVKYEHVGQYPIKFLKVMCCYFRGTIAESKSSFQEAFDWYAASGNKSVCPTWLVMFPAAW